MMRLSRLLCLAGRPRRCSIVWQSRSSSSGELPQDAVRALLTKSGVPGSQSTGGSDEQRCLPDVTHAASRQQDHSALKTGHSVAKIAA